MWLIVAGLLLIVAGCGASGGTGTIEESEENDRIDRELQAEDDLHRCKPY